MDNVRGSCALAFRHRAGQQRNKTLVVLLVMVAMVVVAVVVVVVVLALVPTAPVPRGIPQRGSACSHLYAAHGSAKYRDLLSK